MTPDVLKTIRRSAEVDVMSAQAAHEVFTVADDLIELANGGINGLLNLEKAAVQEALPIQDQICIKAAVSKMRMQMLPDPVHLDMVIPMYHEAIRMAPRTTSTESFGVNSLNPHADGEDALLRKHAELTWLTEGTQHSFRLLFVDDLCDQRSWEMADRLVTANDLPNTSVLSLGEALRDQDISLKTKLALESVIRENRSVRAGALRLGFARALEEAPMDPGTRHIIAYADFDGSYSLTQSGIALWEMFSHKDVQLVSASRQHPLTVQERTRTSMRSTGLVRVKQTIGYLRQHFFGRDVPSDTQSGFKFFTPDALGFLLMQSDIDTGWTFDTQSMARVAWNYSGVAGEDKPIRTFGVVCADSDAQSTANNGDTYFDAVNAVKRIALERHPDTESAQYQLMSFLSSNREDYQLSLRILDDTIDASEWFEQNSTSYTSVLRLRSQIEISRDTTAVGDYYTDAIAATLLTVLKEAK